MNLVSLILLMERLSKNEMTSFVYTKSCISG